MDIGTLDEEKAVMNRRESLTEGFSAMAVPVGRVRVFRARVCLCGQACACVCDTRTACSLGAFPQISSLSLSLLAPFSREVFMYLEPVNPSFRWNLQM